MSDPKTGYRCSTCDRVFDTEQQIREHQDLYASLSRLDPAVDRHDHESWSRCSMYQRTDFDVIADVVNELCDLATADPGLLERMRPRARLLVIDQLTERSRRLVAQVATLRARVKLNAADCEGVEMRQVRAWMAANGWAMSANEPGTWRGKMLPGGLKDMPLAFTPREDPVRTINKLATYHDRPALDVLDEIKAMRS